MVGYYFYPSPYVLVFAFCILVATVFFRSVARVIAEGWMYFARIIGRVNARILLFLLFYLVFTPWSYVVRLIRPDPLQLEPPEDQSTFKTREKTFSEEDFERVS